MSILYRVIDDKRICLSSLYSSLIPLFCNKKSNIEKLKMLFWLLKDAQLACKRRPLSPLPTPF